ncbi:MAG TPA: DinB family protein [Candidatus Polarisedimenticolia bacterium]|nr:DinB family protein [Candidatus Polarisedimenticolia bacterium]
MILDSDRCAKEINEARLRAEALALGLTPKQFTTQPEAGKWSIAECILHLNVTASVMQPLMEKAIAQARHDNNVGTGPFGIGLKGRLLVWIAEPPPKFRMPAPPHLRPPARIDDPLKLLPDFLKAQAEWERLIRESAGLDLAKIKVGKRFSPFRARFAAALPWMMAHQRRHLVQAENVKRQIFSAAPKASTQAG